jgi:hypothetical protein
VFSDAFVACQALAATADGDILFGLRQRITCL